MERAGQIDRGLPAQRGDHSDRMFQLDDIHHILDGERLKIEFVAGGVIGGDGLGVVVDDDRLIPCLPDPPDRVDGGVVELHPLSDPDRAAAEDEDLFAVGGNRLVFGLVGRVEIGHIALKLRRAGVDHLVDRQDTEPAAQLEDLPLGLSPPLGEIPIADPHPLCVPQHGRIEGMRRDDRFELDDVAHLLEEEQIDPRRIVDQAEVRPAADQFGDREQPVVGALPDVGEQLLGGGVVKLLAVQVPHPGLEGCAPP